MTRGRAAAVAGVAVLVLAACGSSTGQRLPDAHAQPALAQSPVPAPSGLLVSGQLTAGIVPTLPVQQYLDHQKKPAGFDIDLLNAIGSQMGLKVGFFVVASEADVVPGVVDPQRKYEVGVADQVETPNLTTGIKTLPYFTTGQTLLVPENDSKTSQLADLCGTQVGALKSSPGEDEVLRQNESGCPGKAIHYHAYDDGTKGVDDLRAGKLAAYIDEYAGAVYFARVYTGLKVVQHLIAPSNELMVFSVSDAPLHDAIAAALDRLKQDGTYARLLRQWGLEQGALNSTASPAPSSSP